MIDELPMLAALGAYTEKGIEIHDAAELRVKESDRIATLATGLRQMGAGVEEFPDGLRVAGRPAGKLCGAKVDPQGDHRIAMALSVAALGAESDTVIRDSEVRGGSVPGVFATLERLAHRRQRECGPLDGPRVQRHGGGPDPSRDQHLGQPGAVRARPQERRVAQHPGEPAHLRRPAVSRLAARSDAVGAQHARGGRRRAAGRPPCGDVHRHGAGRRAASRSCCART